MRIASLFALAGLGLSLNAHAEPGDVVTASVTGDCGGDVTLTVDGTDNYRVVVGSASEYTVTMGSCTGTVLGVDGDVTAPMTASSVTFTLHAGYCGSSLQVMSLSDDALCELSGVHELPRNIDEYELGYADGLAECAYTDSDDDTYDDASYDAGAASEVAAGEGEAPRARRH